MSTGHRSAEYARAARRVRRRIAAQLRAGNHVSCVECPFPIVEGQAFHVAHIVALALGGRNEDSNLGAAHARCNLRAGGRLGAASTTNATRKARRLPEW